MFKKGEYVVYGSIGACEVTDIATVDFQGVPKDKWYYILHPCSQKDSKVFVSVDNQKTLRKVLTKEAAEALIEDMENIEDLKIEDAKYKEKKYKEILRSSESREWLRMIKTLNLLKQDCIKKGKKMLALDERYLKLAEESLYSELAISFELPKENVKENIIEKINHIEEIVS